MVERAFESLVSAEKAIVIVEEKEEGGGVDVV
jgi:hypothetical protein